MAEVDGGNKGVVLDADLMMVLVALLQASQDGDAFGRRGLIYHDHLETALKGLVRLEVFLVLVQSGRAYGPEFTPREGRLQDIGRVHCAGCTSRAHERMDFIYEEDYLTGGVHYFLDHALEPFLEFALVLCTRNQGAHVQGIDFLGLQVLGDIAVHYVLGDAFGNGSLADAGFADQDGVVLGPSGQYLEHAPYLVVTADDRVKFAL